MNTNRKIEFKELLAEVPEDRLPILLTGMKLILAKDKRLLELIADGGKGAEMFDYINAAHEKNAKEALL